MKKLVLSLTLLLAFFVLPSKGQPLARRSPYNVSQDRLLYTIGYAHLDTEWNWDYPTTINDHIKRTMEENFRLFEKYPDYVFNFTGSRRYNMMKEYYPELFKKVQDYVKAGRWYVSGSSVDEGEVNITSSESLIRQILYGNEYFKKEFGKESYDYMLPDCFGFLCNLPTVFHYCGLLGFSTQKLTWHSAVGVPFNVGVWNGPDGKGVIAALNATDYGGPVEPRLDASQSWIKRLDADKAKTGYALDYRYYGVGDMGGAPRENDVKNAVGSLGHSDSNFKVLLTSSDQMYKDITPQIRKRLPVYSGDLLLTEHSAGSMTSQAFMKRMNRKNELLAQSAEQIAVAANYLNGSAYPTEKMAKSWDLVLGSQFHDILPGTSIPKAYEYAWNDEFIAANGFAEALRHGVSETAGRMNTQTEGRSIVVYNPVAKNRDDIVTAELAYSELPGAISVYDKDGREVPSQIISREGNKLKIVFEAVVPSVGLSVYDVREKASDIQNATLKVTSNSLENEYYKVKFLPDGDIASIWDKKASKELLSKPAGLDFHQERPSEWPAWDGESTHYIGNREPKIQGGLNNSIQYKNWNLSFLLDFRLGGAVYNGTDYLLTNYGLSKRTLNRQTLTIKGVVNTGTTDTPVYQDQTFTFNAGESYDMGASTKTSGRSIIQDYWGTYYPRESSNFMTQVNWLRLRSVTLSYSCPQSLLTKLKYIKGCTFSVTGTNLLLLTNYKGLDPEASAAGSGTIGSSSVGFDYCGVPATAGMSFGVNLTF